LLVAVGAASFNRLRTVSAAAITTAAAQPTPAPATPKPSPQLSKETYGKLPLSFEPNRGQGAADAKFLSRGTGYQLTLTAKGAVLKLRQQTQPKTTQTANSAPRMRDEQTSAKDMRPRHAAHAAPAPMIELGMKLVGANPKVQIEPEHELTGKTNYLVGRDPAEWRTDVPTYAQAHYREIYPGVDLLFYGNQRQLEYDFLVSPGAPTDQIRLAFSGATKLALDAQGDLVLTLPGGGTVRQPKPVLYQEVAGERREVSGGYVLQGKNQIGFRVGEYDHTLPLVIDPILVYSTYLDFFAESQNGGIAIDATNNVYLTGSDGANVYVTKLNAQGTGFVYTTLVGGGDGDIGLDIAVDSAGDAYVSGDAFSLDFPTVNAFQSVKSSEAINVADVFVLKLNPAGSALVFSTYLGGTDDDQNYGIALDPAGNAYVTGYTESPIIYVNAPPGDPFPTVNPYQFERAGGLDAFLTKFTPTGAVVFSTYLGGTGDDLALDVAVDSDGAPYLTGVTDSTDYPRQSALQQTLKGAGDVFITKFNPQGTALTYSTYLGGTGEDVALGIALDPSKNIYLTGYTYSSDYPTLNAAHPTSGGGVDAFVTKVNAVGSSLVYSTYMGGSRGEEGAGIALGADNSAYITGYTSSTNFPIINAIQPTNAGGVDAIIFKLNPAGSAVNYATYLGGGSGTFGGADYGQGIVVDSTGNAITLGRTYSDNFPVINPIGSASASDDSSFLAKISESGSQTLYHISGRIESNVGNPLYDVTLTLSGSQTATTTSGSLYTFTGLAAGGTYTVTPTRTGMTFDPPSVTFTNLQSDQTADFMQAPRSYHINGRITDAQGHGIPNVTVDIGGYYYPIERYTDAQGNFGLMYLEGGRTYTVTPRSNSYSFTPRSYTYENMHSNVTPTFTAVSNTNLSVSLTNPAAGATFQAPAQINLSADAASTGSPINRVEFYANANLIGTDTSAPYSFDWTNVAGGSYSLTAIAYDNAGALKQSAARSIIVNSTVGPVVSITSPADNTTLLPYQYITLSADATSANGAINKVEFYEGTRLLGDDHTGPGPFTFAYYLYEGDYVLTAVAYDAAGAVTRSAPVHLSVRANQLPTVALANPGGPFFPSAPTITLDATASDPDGTVSAVKFYANSTLLSTDTTAPYSFTWSNVPNGDYTLVASATDNQGGTAYSNYRDIHVGNSAPVASIQSPASGAQYGAPASITITAGAFDNDGTITQVEFIADGQVVGIDTTQPYSFTWNNVPAGDYDVAVRATDNTGATGLSTFILVRVFAQLPQVSITRPTSGAHFEAPASIVLESNATSSSGITSVWYYANGRNIGIVHDAPLYRMNWDGVLAGTYTITAEAWDQNSAVGRSAPITVTVSGAAWEKQAPRISGLNTETLESVSMVSATEGWAVGDGGLIVHTTDGGLNWTRQVSGTTDPLNVVYFKDALHGWASGNDMIFTVDGGQTWQQSNWSPDTVYSLTCADLNTCFAGRGLNYFHKTTDGGRNWLVVTLPFDVGSVQFFDAQNGVASGGGGVLRTTNGGQTWTIWARTHGGFFINFNQGWSLGGNTAEKTVDGGLTWQPLTLPAGTWVYDYRFIDAQNGWGVGSQENIVRTTDGGQTWTTQRAPTFSSPLWSIDFKDPLHAVTVGNGGTVLSTNDGGQTWTRSERAFNPQPINRVTATDANHAWTANNGNEIMYTANGGATWSHVTLTPPTSGNVVGIDFADNANGWAAIRKDYSGPSYIYRSGDGGQTWTRSTNAPSTDAVYDIAALDAQTAVAVGYGTNGLGLVRRTADGGQTWTLGTLPANTRALYGVDFINATTGWACGNLGTVLKTTDGGQTWTRLPLSADNLDDISFADANNGWTLGGYYFYHTTNGGQTWVQDDTGGSFILRGIHALSPSTAWMVGDNWVGRTTNGGATWTAESLGDYRYVRSVYFTDADNGWVGANWTTGEIYHRTGGSNPNAPHITITQPADGAAFPSGSNLTVAADASSPNGTPIASVDFYVNNQLFTTDTTAPYGFTWQGVPANVYVLTAVVTDTAGAQGTSAPITVTSQLPVDPTVYITSPANGTSFPAPANIVVSAFASGANSSRFITRVEFYAGPNLIGTDTNAPYNVAWNNVPAGVYTLTAKAFDNQGAQAQSNPVTIDVGNTSGNAPTVAITSPANGATFNSPADITINADAADTNGTVTKVDFFADARFLGTDTTAPYSVLWEHVTAGTYNITARATDNSGTPAVSSPVSITVAGPPPPGVNITGHVVSPTGRVLPNITITLGGAISRTTTTDTNGDYNFVNLTTGGNYTLTPSFDQGSYIFDPAQYNLINLQSDQTRNFVGTNLNGDEGDTRSLVISEFRFSGPNGPLDEFIEFYNSAGRDLIVQTADGSPGWALVASDGIARFIIPNGTVIPARGHFLATGSAYSLGAYAAGDVTYTLDIPDNAGVALFLTASPTYFMQPTRFDAFGFGAVTNSLYREGFSAAVASEAQAENASYVRKAATNGLQDTDENSSDFELLAPGRLLGAPGPENLSSPIASNAVKASLVDPQVAATAAPNRVRDFAPVTNGVAGTLTIRRRFKNSTGAPITALRFRITDITTQGTPNNCGGCTLADLRVLSSNDTSVQLTNGSTVIVRGTLLEQAAAQPAGGGMNSAVTVALPGGALSPGGSINVQFTLGIQQTGSFRFFVNVEALTGTTAGGAPQRNDGKLPESPPGKF
jgi:photosystem II stability/assembly factor-like uncharacterized protein